MIQKHRLSKPASFAETLELVQQYIRDEIILEAKNKQLYYHNLNHALGVQRRSRLIFQAIRPALVEKHSSLELARLAGLIDVCALAHDMVQIFEPSLPPCPRKRKLGLSEETTANKLLNYIKKFNQALTEEKLDVSILISDREQEIIRDGIIATICVPDPYQGKIENIASSRSIYQPYLYDAKSKVSIVGSIIALADLGTLGIEGVEAYIQDGILVFLEDNPHLHDLVANCDLSDCSESKVIRKKLLAMTQFIVKLAHERQALFEVETAGFETRIRQILQNQVFVHLNQESVNQVRNLVPHKSDATLTELVSFFCSKQIVSIQ